MLNLVHKELLKPKKKLYFHGKENRNASQMMTWQGAGSLLNLFVLFILKYSFEFRPVAEQRRGASGEEKLPPAAVSQTPGVLDTCQFFALSVGP